MVHSRGGLFDNPHLQRLPYPSRRRSTALAEAYLANRRRRLQLQQEIETLKAAQHRQEQLRQAGKERSYRYLQHLRSHRRRQAEIERSRRQLQQRRAQQRYAEIERSRRHSQQRRAQEQARLMSGYASQWHRSESISSHDDIRRLAVGGMSKTVKIVRIRRTGDTRVLKRVEWDRNSRLKEELEVLKRIPKHCNLNYMVEYAWSPNQSQISFVLEFCNLGDLLDDLASHMRSKRHYQESFIWHFLRGMGDALAWCHTGIVDAARTMQCRPNWNTIWHLDIKPANIFLSSPAHTGQHPRVKLGDFGCAVTKNDIMAGRASVMEHIWGTDEWRPPHSFPSQVGGKRNCRIGYHTDIWAIGAVAASLCRLSGEPNRDQVCWDYASPCGPRYTKGLNDFVRACVRRNFSQRPAVVHIVHKIVSMGRA